MEENENLNPEPNKKSNKSLFIVVGIMAIVIVALVGYIIVSKSNDSKQSNAENNQTASSKVSNEVKETEKEKEEDDDEEEKNTSKKKNTKNSSKNSTNTNTNTNSSFGKKDKNQTNTSTTNTTTPSTELSGDWKSGEFTINGFAFKLHGDYKTLKDNGWTVDFAGAGYEEGYILNKGDKTYGTIDLENPSFDDANVQIGLINLGDGAKDAEECQIWSMSVDNKYADTPVEFTLPGGIKYGSTLAEVEAAYGKPADEADIYRAEELKYTTYTYDNDLKPKLRLTIYDDGGVTAFNYQTYAD